MSDQPRSHPLIPAWRNLGVGLEFLLLTAIVESVLITPLLTGSIRLALDQWGRASVGNFEIVTFLLSPIGILGLLLFLGAEVAIFYFRIAGLILILSGGQRGWLFPSRLLHRVPGLARLGLWQAGIAFLVALPFLAIIGINFLALWADEDLYRLVKMRPRVFWVGIGIAGVSLLAYACIMIPWISRWVLAVPYMLANPRCKAREAVRISVTSTHRKWGKITRGLTLWVLTYLGLSSGMLALVGFAGNRIVNILGTDPRIVVPGVAVLLGTVVVLAFLLSASMSLILAAMVLRWYETIVGPLHAEEVAPMSWLRKMRLRMALVAGFAVVMGFTSWMVVDDSRIADRVEVIAHRAGYVRAPENSLSALRQAIAAKADWVEIDVQLTADGALVIVHDFDLLRVGGSPLRIASATLADIQQVDIGSPVGPEFAGERIPTLEEFLTAANGQVGVLIELKFPPGSQVEPLTDAVLDTVRRLNAMSWCRVCSQSYAGIQRVRSQEPSIPIGFIAGAALGDLTQLQVDFLMVEARMATPELCDRARRRKMGIFAWTIKDAGQIGPLVDRGITGLIADDPEMVQVKLQELAQLDPVERILYRVRNVLAGQL